VHTADRAAEIATGDYSRFCRDAGGDCAIIGAVNLNIPRPSSNAPESMALYEKLRKMAADPDTAGGDQAILDETISGLFNIVAKLEAQVRAE
jgi:hypothetical protein